MLGENIYNATAELGTIRSYITVIVLSVISVFLIIFAIVLFLKDQSDLIDSVAIVEKIINCSQNNNCEIVIKYNVDGTIYKKIIQTNNKIYNVDGNVDITYNKTNPNDVSEKTLRYRTISYILFFFFLIMIALAYGSYYLASKSKIYSAALGAQSVFSIFDQNVI